jgi:NADH-quinone oxidoreductase subunit L
LAEGWEIYLSHHNSLGKCPLFSLLNPCPLESPNSPFSVKLYDFISLGSYTLTLGLYFDPLSAITTSLVCLVSTLIFIYSIGYMENFFGQWTYKFYAYLSLFLFSMLLIVLSDNLLGMFFGWEGVGLASYLLIGYFHQQKYATNSAFEAFVMNRIGDWLYPFWHILHLLPLWKFKPFGDILQGQRNRP